MYINAPDIMDNAISIQYPAGFNFNNCYISHCDTLTSENNYQSHFNNKEIIQNVMNLNNVVLILRDSVGSGKQIRVIFEKI